jgi:oligogalacturonide lyase
MTKGQQFPAEWRTYTDPVSGAPVQQLTNYKGHSHHFYFTNPGWYDSDQKLLFASDRNNRTNLYSLDLLSGIITQLTDLDPVPLPREVEFLRACVSPQNNAAYFWHEYKLMALDLTTLEEQVLYVMPYNFDVSMINVTADGNYVCASISQDMSDRFPVDLLRGYVGFRETWEANPLSRIMRVPVNGGRADIVWEEEYWVGHVNTSPTQPHLLTFCHEGPWHLVDNRIWGLDMDTGRAWQIRPREEPEERVGHEYWHADGVYVSYHGQKSNGDKFFGKVRTPMISASLSVMAGKWCVCGSGTAAALTVPRRSASIAAACTSSRLMSTPALAPTAAMFSLPVMSPGMGMSIGWRWQISKHFLMWRIKR